MIGSFTFGELPFGDSPDTGGSGVAYTLSCSNGSYAVTGQASVLNIVRTLSCSNGSYTVTGQASVLKVGHILSCSNGTYGVVGQTSTLTPTYRYKLSAANGAYAVTGQSSVLNYHGAPTAYTLTTGVG